MGRKSRDETPERPNDNLPPNELQAAWDKYLDYHVGPAKVRKPKEVLLTPMHLEAFLDWLGIGTVPEIEGHKEEKVENPKIALLLTALNEAIKELPEVNRSIVKRYYGLDWVAEPQIERVIAEEMSKISGFEMSRSNVSRRLNSSRTALRRIMRKKLPKILRQELGLT